MGPEAWKEYTYCDWDGDGHFNMSQYAKVGLPTLGHAVAFTRLADEAAGKGCLLILLSSRKRLAAGAVLAGAMLVLSHSLSGEEAWREIVQIGPGASRDPW